MFISSIIPISSVVPVGNTVGGAAGSVGGAAAGQVAKEGLLIFFSFFLSFSSFFDFFFLGTNSLAEKGIKKGAQKAGESSSLQRMDTTTFESKVHAKFAKTKVIFSLGRERKGEEDLCFFSFFFFFF